jgi:hypothetical protein
VNIVHPQQICLKIGCWKLYEFFVICVGIHFGFVQFLGFHFIRVHSSSILSMVGTFVPKYLPTKRWHMRNADKQFASLKNEKDLNLIKLHTY